MDILEKFLIAIGGGTVALVALLTIFKSMFLKLFDNAIDTTFNKNIEKFRNKLSRTTTAFEYLIKKEFEYYEKLDPQIAILVPLVQDLIYYAKDDEESEESNHCNKYRECLLTYLTIIPKIKNDNILFQPYIPDYVWFEVGALIRIMQQEMVPLQKTAKSLFGLDEIPVDVQKVEESSNNVLKQLATVEYAVKKRLTELSEA